MAFSLSGPPARLMAFQAAAKFFTAPRFMNANESRRHPHVSDAGWREPPRQRDAGEQD